MADTYCHDGYCETTDEKAPNMEISNAVIISVFTLIMIVFTAIWWYGASTGLYVDPTYLN